MIELFAWAVEKTTLYTITTERVVMRFGVAISMTLNLPFRQIDSVSLAKIGEKAGVIAIALLPGHVCPGSSSGRMCGASASRSPSRA